MCIRDSPVHRVIGSGTVLDTARLKYLLSRHLDVDSRSVHAVVIGEHGDSELAVWSGANISGIDLDHFCELRGHFDHEAAMKKIYEDVRDSAYRIIEEKGATYYGIAMAVARIADVYKRQVLRSFSQRPMSIKLSSPEKLRRDLYSLLPITTLAPIPSSRYRNSMFFTWLLV